MGSYRQFLFQKFPDARSNSFQKQEEIEPVLVMSKYGYCIIIFSYSLIAKTMSIADNFTCLVRMMNNYFVFCNRIMFGKNLSEIGKSPLTLSVGKKLTACWYKDAFVFSLVALPSSTREVYIFNNAFNFRVFFSHSIWR